MGKLLNDDFSKIIFSIKWSINISRLIEYIDAHKDALKQSPKLQIYFKFSDALVRQYLSTSPEVEKEDFAHTTKQALKCILEHPDPLKSIFKDEKEMFT